MSKIKIVSSIKDDIVDDSGWCVPFQLAWNELQYNILGNNFEFNKKNKYLSNLTVGDNREYYLNKNDYYVKSGGATLNLKNQIQNDILDKFNERSDILDKFQFDNADFSSRLFIYAILVKHFKFNGDFDESTRLFGKKKQQVKFFGADNFDNRLKQVNPMFYNKQNDFAVRVLDADEKNSLIFYRTDGTNNFEDAYKECLQKSYVSHNGVKVRSFFAPNININLLQDFECLKNETVVRKSDNMPMQIAEAMQTIKFKLDKSGAELKSEAGISMRVTAIFHEETSACDFDFNDSFYLFYVDNICYEHGNDRPCMALRVNDIDKFIL